MNETSPCPAVAPFPADQLLDCDVLLMMGEGPLSALIAWCGDSIYSHAALLADGGDLIEASAVGGRRYPLQKRLADTANYYFVDAFRAHPAGLAALDPADRALVLAHGISLLGVPYPIDQLATLGIVVAVRGKIPENPWVRLVVREALDHVVSNDPSQMVCSEFVYRSFAECAAQPIGRLAPEIVVEPRGTAPFPDINWSELWKEIWPLIRPRRRGEILAAAGVQGTGHSESLPPDPDLMLARTAPVGEDELLRQIERTRQALGISEAEPQVLVAGDASGVEQSPIPVPDPNPKLVMPLDLMASPSNRLLGRLMQR